MQKSLDTLLNYCRIATCCLSRNGLSVFSIVFGLTHPWPIEAGPVNYGAGCTVSENSSEIHSLSEHKEYLLHSDDNSVLIDFDRSYMFFQSHNEPMSGHNFSRRALRSKLTITASRIGTEDQFYLGKSVRA